METIECPVCGMTYTGKRCPVCGAKVKIRYRSRGQAAQAAPEPEPTFYDAPTGAQPTAVPKKKKAVQNGKKRMKASTLVVLCAVLASSLAGVFNNVSDSDTETRYEYTIDEDMYDYGIESQVIYDENGVRVEIQHFLTDDYTTEIHVHLVNDTNEDVRVSTELMTIDGVASDEWIYTLVEAHGEVDDVIRIYRSDLEELGVDAVHELSFSLLLRDDATYNEIDRTERLVFQTPVDGSVSHEVPEGTVVYESDVIRVTKLEPETEDDRFEMRYYVENLSDKDLSFLNPMDLEINGEELNSSYVYGPDIPAGCSGYLQVVAYDYDETVETIEGTVNVKEFGTWDDLDQFSVEYTNG